MDQVGEARAIVAVGEGGNVAVAGDGDLRSAGARAQIEAHDSSRRLVGRVDVGELLG